MSVAFAAGDAAAYLDRVRPYVAPLESELLEVSHRIHANPEIRFTEQFASDLLAKTLQQHGFTVETGIADLPTAFVATTAHPEGGPTLGIFCEYDALEGIGHGCGHNVIASAGLGAAIAVKRWLDDNRDTPGRLVVLGSPGEEGGGGKVFLLDAGYLDGVDAAMMVHPGGENHARRTGLARTLMEVAFTGKAAHAAGAPHEGINALDAVNLTLVAIGLLRQQIRDDSRIHAIVVEGGQAPNIIPEHAAIRAYVRSPDGAYLSERLVPAVENCVHGAALATGATADIAYPLPTYREMRSNEVLAQLSEANLAALGRELSRGQGAAHMGSTDMGNISHVVPSVHPHLQLRSGITMHSRESAEAAAATEGDAAVVDGALELAMTAVELYTRPELLDAVTAAFRAGR